MKDENGSGYGHKPLDDEDDISFEDGFIRIVRRFRPRAQNIWRNRKRLIFLNTAVGVIVTLALVLLMKNYYISTITILPDYGEKETALSQLSSLASLAGVSVGQGTPTDVYENLLGSQAVVACLGYSFQFFFNGTFRHPPCGFEIFYFQSLSPFLMCVSGNVRHSSEAFASPAAAL